MHTRMKCVRGGRLTHFYRCRNPACARLYGSAQPLPVCGFCGPNFGAPVLSGRGPGEAVIEVGGSLGCREQPAWPVWSNAELRTGSVGAGETPRATSGHATRVVVGVLLVLATLRLLYVLSDRGIPFYKVLNNPGAAKPSTGQPGGEGMVTPRPSSEPFCDFFRRFVAAAEASDRPGLTRMTLRSTDVDAILSPAQRSWILTVLRSGYEGSGDQYSSPSREFAERHKAPPPEDEYHGYIVAFKRVGGQWKCESVIND